MFCSSFLLVLLSCQYGDSYRIYILPERGSFCLGVFSGDACLTWSEYSVRPTLVDHSTTLIFTPGNYNYRSGRTFYVANIKSFTMIGDRARILFQLSISNIGYVGMHNLTFANNPQVSVRNVQSFFMVNCALSKTSSSTYYFVGLYLYASKMNRVVESMFVKVPIDVQSLSTLLVNGSSFSNVSGTCIGADSSSNLVIHNSVFVNNYQSRSGYGIIYSQRSLRITDCLFDRNSATSGSGAVVYSNGDLTVTNSTFDKNEAIFYERRYYYSTYYPRYYRGGYAIRGRRNINVSNCSFRYYTQTSSTIYSYGYNSYYGRRNSYQVYIINSNFYHSNRSIFSYNNVTMLNSIFYNITAQSGSGGVVYSTKPVTAINCTFINSTVVSGAGGVVHSTQIITVHNSTFTGSSANNGAGGSLYSRQAIMINDSQISGSIATGDGGAVYSLRSVTLISTNITNSVSQYGRGGAIYGLGVTINNSAVVRNIMAAGDGGAVYSRGHVTLMSTNITNSVSQSGRGGAVYSAQSVSLSSSNITTSVSRSGNGGAIYGLSVTMINSTVRDVVAAGDGGAIFNKNYVKVIHSSISHCSALNGKGGAIYSAGSHPESTVIPHSEPNVIFSGSNFSYSRANSGGVLYVSGHYNHYMEFSYSTFTFNEAIGDSTGGGVSFMGNTSLSITNCVLSNNMATTDGGVLNLYFSSVSIQRSSLSRNTAVKNGGALYGRNYSTNITVVQTLFKHNEAENGGAFYVRRFNSYIKLVNSTFVENHATNQVVSWTSE